MKARLALHFVDRLERHLAQTQRTLNTLLTIQIQMNQSRINESMGTLQQFGVDPNAIIEQVNAPMPPPDLVPQISSNQEPIARDNTVSTQRDSSLQSTRSRMVRMNACEPSATNPLSTSTLLIPIFSFNTRL